MNKKGNDGGEGKEGALEKVQDGKEEEGKKDEVEKEEEEEEDDREEGGEEEEEEEKVPSKGKKGSKQDLMNQLNQSELSAIKDSTVRKFNVPKINFKAKT